MMVSVILAPNQFRLYRPSFLHAKFPTVFFLYPATRQFPAGNRKNRTALKPESQFSHSVGVARRCKIGENEDSSTLEQEVLEFMLLSEEPDKFPSRQQLIEAGRRDLADAILRRGGWMTRGWDSVSDDELEISELDVVLSKWDSISAKIGREKAQCELKVNGVEHSEVSSPELKIPQNFLSQENQLEGTSAEMGDVDDSCASYDSSNPPASSSGRSIEIAAEGRSGVEGILNGLEKHRNLNLGLPVERKRSTLTRKENGLHAKVLDTTGNFYPRGHETTPSLENNMVSFQDNMLSNPGRANKRKTMPKLNGAKCSLQPDEWRTWRIERSGFSDSDFEAAEIDFNDSEKGRAPDSETSHIISPKKGNKKDSPEMIEDLKPGGKNRGDKIRNRLQNLDLELSSALCLLKSSADNISQKVDYELLPEDLRNLSDDWEFKENEIMKSQDKLRSLRARFAVLEGKVALAKIGTQKVIDEKQKRINDARKALKLLRNTCVVWPNSASKVLLTGSFDGWATQRKMEKLSNGTFCAWLRLYPGRYEIKFIVDGTWKVDPLRPIVANNGNENNLLIIS
ncbi:hypothetical protein V2J09_003701 [Rumex salicifolius]